MWCVLSAILLLVIRTEGLLLCDGDCMDNPLEICNKSAVDPARLNRPVITLLGLFPCNTARFRARGLTPAAQMAVNQINNHSPLLPDFRLQMLVNNSMCAPLPAVRSYIFQIDPDHNQQPIHAIVGPGCSSAAQPVAELANFFNLIVVSYTATSPALSNEARFPTFFRSISSDVSTVGANVALIRQFGWHQVAIITQNVNLFLEVSDQLKRQLAQSGLNVISSGLSYFDSSSGIPVIDTIQNSGARIVIMNVFEDSARQLFCLARSRNMIFPHFVWMSYGWYSQRWWDDRDRDNNSIIANTNCTLSQMESAIERSLSFHHFPTPTESERTAPTDVNFTPNEFWENFTEIIRRLDYSPNEAISQASYVYDAVWMVAFALNKSIAKLPPGKTLADFNYENTDFRDIFIQSLSTFQFTGVTGDVVINNRERQPNLRMEQYRRLPNGTIKSFEFAMLPPSGSSLRYTNNESPSTVWPGGTPSDVERDHIDLGWLALYGSISGIGIVFAAVCFLFNFSCRRKPIVKATSPYLNMLIITGAIFIYADVVLFGIDGRVTSDDVLKVTCNARIWAASIGFSLLFGPMLAKAVRVYFVVTRSQKDLKQRKIKDWQLILFVVILVAIDIGVLLIVTLIDATRVKIESRIIQREGGEIPRLIEICSASDDTATTIWIILWLCYKGILLLVGLFFAAATQNVKIKELNDSKTIAFAVYCISAISAVLTFIGFFLEEQLDEQYAITGAFMLLTVTVVLCMIFLPQIKALFEDPSGELKIHDSTGSNQMSHSVVPKSHPLKTFSSEQENHIQNLNTELISLRSELNQLKRRTPKNDSSAKYRDNTKEHRTSNSETTL